MLISTSGAASHSRAAPRNKVVKINGSQCSGVAACSIKLRMLQLEFARKNARCLWRNSRPAYLPRGFSNRAGSSAAAILFFPAGPFIVKFIDAETNQTRTTFPGFCSSDTKYRAGEFGLLGTRPSVISSAAQLRNILKFNVLPPGATC
jgi:hypothetical protein